MRSRAHIRTRLQIALVTQDSLLEGSTTPAWSPSCAWRVHVRRLRLVCERAHYVYSATASNKSLHQGGIRTWPLPRAPVELWFGCTRLIGLVCHGESVRRTRPDRVHKSLSLSLSLCSATRLNERRRRPRECVPVGQKKKNLLPVLVLESLPHLTHPIAGEFGMAAQNFGKTKKNLL